MDVTKYNFESKLPEIEENLRHATFLAIDTEFTALSACSEKCNPSLFDGASQRYQKLKMNIDKVIIMQIGLSTFQFVRDENKYIVHTYRIPVFPSSFGTVDVVYLSQASSIRFLSNYKFDFNKFIYDGVPYLNMHDENILRRRLQDYDKFRDVENLNSDEDEYFLTKEIEQVTNWITNAEIGGEMLIRSHTKYKNRRELSYGLHLELRERFKCVWTYDEDDGSVRIQKIRSEDHAKLKEDKSIRQKLDDDLITSLLGFSHVFKLLIQLRKPMIGHNCLLDFMLMYQQFYEPLPDCYETFKNNVNRLFPAIYDTKFISFELKYKLERGTLTSTVLYHLYNFFKEGRGANMSAYSPRIEWAHATEEMSEKLHDAAWDSYCAGTCFIRMAFIVAVKEFEIRTARPVMSRELFKAVDSMKNRVNIIRAAVSHVCFDGPDPHSKRQWLSVKAKHNELLYLSQVYELLSPYDPIDVKMCSKHAAIVAVTSKRSADIILKMFSSHEDLLITKYNVLKHNKALRTLMWFGVISTGGIGLWLISNNLLNKPDEIAVKK